MLLPAPVAVNEISESLTLQGFLKLKMKYGLAVDVLIKRGEDARSYIEQACTKSVHPVVVSRMAD